MTIDITKSIVKFLGTYEMLGVNIHCGISWTCHILILLPCLRGALFALKRLKYLCSSEVLKTVCLFRLYNDLRDLFWGSGGYMNILKVFRLQKKAIRTLAGINSRDSCRDYYVKLHYNDNFQQV